MGFLIDTGIDTRLTQQIIVVTRYMTMSNFTRQIHPNVTDRQNHYYTECNQIEPTDFNRHQTMHNVKDHQIDPPDCNCAQDFVQYHTSPD